MFELNGQPVTLEQLQSDAAQYNATFEEYLEEMKKNGLVEKTNGSQIEDATAESNVTASEPVDFLSELQPAAQSSTAVVPSIDQSELNKFYSIAPTSPVVAYSKTEKDKNIAELNLKKIIPEKIQQTTGISSFGVPTTTLVDKQLSDEDLKYNEKIQEEIDAQVNSSLEKLEAWAEHDFFTKKEYLRGITNTKTLTAYEELEDPDKQDLKEVFKRNILSAGGFGKSYFPGLNETHIDKVFEDAFANAKNSEKGEEQRKDIDIAIDEGNKKGISIDENVNSLNSIMKSTYGKKPEQELALLLDFEEKIATGKIDGFFPEDKKNRKEELINQLFYKDELKTVFDPITKETRLVATGKRIPKDGGYKVFHDFNTGQNIQNPTERKAPTGTVDVTSAFEMYMSKYKNTSRGDLAKFNDRLLLEESGYNIEGNQIESVAINDETLRGLLSEYKRPNSAIFDVPIKKLTELGYIANKWDFWSKDVFAPGADFDEIKPISYEGKPYSNEQEFIEFLEVRNQQGLDIAAKKHALWQTYHLNRDVTSIAKTRTGQVLGAFSETVFGPEITQEQFGFTNQKTVDVFAQEIAPASGLELSKDQKRHTERTLGDQTYESVGSLGGLMVYLTPMGRALKPATTAIARLNAPRYFIKGKQISSGNLIKFASKNRTSVEDLVKVGTVVKKPASVWRKGQALALGATLEEFKMREGLGALTDDRLAFERGVGAGFYLGGQLLPYSFANATKYNRLNKALDLTFKNGPAFAIAAEAGEAINAVVDDLQGREEFQTFVKKHWGDYDKNVERTILHLITGAGLGLTHTKRFDFKSFEGIKNFKDQAVKKVIEKQDALENQAKKEGVDITNEKAYKKWLDGQYAVGNKDLQKMERYREDFLEADAYLEKVNEVEEWTDPARAKKHYEEHYKGLKDLYKSRGKELIVEVTNQPLYQEFFDAKGNLQRQEVSALFTRLSDVRDGTTTKNQAKIQINTSKSKGKQTASHEGLHAYMDLMFDGKPALKQNFANQLISVLSEVNLGTGIDLYSEILKDPALAGKKQLQLEELMTYTAEFLARKENRYLIQEGVVGKVADFFNNFSKSVTGKPADAFTHQDIINILGRYSAKGDYSKLKGLDRYVEIGENIEGQMARRPIETMRDQTKRLEASKKQIIQKIKDLNVAKLENYKSEIADLQKELRENINPELNKINDIIKKGDPRDILNQFLSQKGSDGNFKNKYTKEEIKEGGVGRKDFNETAKLILESDFIKNMITTGTGELRFKKGSDNEKMFYQDVMSRIQERLEKNYDPKVNPDVFGWLTGVSGGGDRSIIFRAKGDVMNEAKKQVKTVSTEIIEGFENMFGTGSGGGGGKGSEAKLERNFFTETVKYSSEALNKIQEAVVRENIDVDGLSYKDVKNLVAGQKLINGKAPTSSKNVEATGPLKEVLEAVGEKHGIPLERILARQDLTTTMRNDARKVIYEERAEKIDGLPEGTTPSGKSAGIANTKLGEFYVKGEAVKMAETGSRQGLPEQSKQEIRENDFLELFGIRPDGTMIEGKQFDGAIREYLKQEASIIANQAARRHAGNLSARIGEGRGIKMASRVFDNYMKAFPKSKPQDVFEAFFRAYYELPGNTKGQDNFFKTTKIVEGFESRDQQIEFGLIESFAVKSKDTQFNFAKSLKSLEATDITVKNGEVVTNKEIQDLSIKASRRVEDGNVIVDANQIRKNIQASSEVGQMINSVFPEFFNNKTLASQALFIHQRTTAEGITTETITKRLAKGKGEILTETGESVAGLDFTSGQKTVFENRKKKIDLSPEAEAQLKEIWKDADKIKFNSATSQVTGQNKIREAVAQGKSQIEIDQIIEKYFSPVAEGSKAKYYDMLAKTLELYVKEAPNKQEFLNRAEYVFQGMRSNTNLRMGFRQLVPTLAVYAGKRTFNADQVKLEHLKVNAKQSFKAAELIVTGNWSRYGKETLKDFVGVLSPKELLDIIDAKGGKTNIETLYRLAILEPSTLKEFVTVESKGKENLLDYVLREGKQQLSRDVLRQALSLRTLKENNIKKLKEKGLIGKGEQIGFKQASKDIANHDAAFNLGRKKNKTSRKMRTYDFDDTLATTKSGVRYEMPNPSGKPAPQRKAILLMGSAGAGKTTIIDQLGLRKQGFKYVNQDVALDWLSKNSGLPKNMNDFTRQQSEKWRDLQYEAAYAAKDKASKLRGKGDGVIIDSTGGNIREISRDFKDAGYDVQVIHVNSSLETALARNRSRTERRLTDTTVKNSYEKVQKSIKGTKELVDFFPKSVKEFVEINTDNLKQGDALPTDFVKKINNFTSGYIKGRINAEQFALEGAKLLEQGAKYDFSEFNKVVEGAPGPLLKSAIENAKKFGTENMFVLTARPAESAGPIREFLKSQGLDIPLENITGLGNSTGEAKARWMLEKFAEGYNDMYFVDDALPNVKAVRDVLNQLDIKSDVQQALATRDLNLGINKMMEHSLGIDAVKRFSKAEAAIRGKNANRRKFFMPDTASDLELLLEPLYGKGKKGIENKKWFQDNFIRKWERGINDFNNARQAITNDYLTLRKNNKDVVKQLPETVEGTNFTVDMAMRVYIWNKNGYTIPDLAPTTQKKLVSHIINNPKLQSYAENVAKLTKVEGGLKEPTVDWYAETIASEIQGLGEGVGRKKYIQDFIEAKNEIFTEANLNKMESKLGRNWRETIEDMFDRMETGRTRSMSIGKIGNKIMNYLNGSTGTIMNFNTRSAALQLISTVNFVNSSFNNPLMAAKAFANQPQYWKDFMTIMNSDMLKQRRQGLQINVSEVELANAAANSKNPARSALAKILKAGYIPTKIADSFAISAGGATYYRNAINKYLKEGLSKTEAEKKAFIDFQAIAERTQQSSRADLLSKQQTSFEGRLILPFANTPMQMNRIMIKEILDLSKGRYKGFYGENSMTSKLSRIGYYGFLQSIIFAGLQSGAFALMTNSDDDEKKVESKLNMLNTTADSFLRGMGIQGAVANSLRLAVQEFFKQDAKKYNADYSEIAEKLLNVSPTVGSKFSKLDAAGNTYKYNKKVIKEEGLTLNGPLLEATTQVIESTTNAPLNRYYKKGNNIQNALDDNYYNWQRILSGLGWSVWGLGPGKPDEERQLESGRYLTKEGLRREQIKKSINQKNAKQKKSNKDPFRGSRTMDYFR